MSFLSIRSLCVVRGIERLLRDLGHALKGQQVRTLDLRRTSSVLLPAPQILRVLKLHYKVASSQLPAPQIAPRTKGVLQSRQFSSSSSPDTPRITTPLPPGGVKNVTYNFGCVKMRVLENGEN